jgi:hypothetical protein
MQVTYNGPGFTIDQDCKDVKGVFSFISHCSEVFGAATTCEFCNGTTIRPRHRKAKDFDFYELLCVGCNATFKFGQRKDDNSLYPKGWEAPYGEQNANGQPAATQKEAAPWE